MLFPPPKHLDELVLSWWKVVDSPEISRDEFEDIIVYELLAESPNDAQKAIDAALHEKFILFDPATEMLSLSPELQKRYKQWQEAGKKKAQEIKEVLSAPWRKKISFDEKELFQIYFTDLADQVAQNNAATILSSKVKIEEKDFAQRIRGQVQGTKFEIDIPHQTIKHDCEDFQQYRAGHKIFCAHLARLIMKLNTQDPEATIKLLQQIVKDKAQWTFE